MKEITARRVHFLARAHDILVERGIDPQENRDLAELLAGYMMDIGDEMAREEYPLTGYMP